MDTSRDWRGGQQQLLLLAGALRGMGCEQVVIASGPVAERFAAAGIATLAPGRAGRRALARADVAHAHDGHAHTYMLRATLGREPLRVLSRRVAYAIRGAASGWKYRRLGLVLAVSEAVRQQVIATGLEPARVEVVSDALDFATLPEPGPARERLRRQLALPAGAPLLVCLSAFTPEKGVPDLVTALGAMPREVHLALAGAGRMEGDLRRLARRLGHAERVHFVAEIAPPASAAEWAAAADILVMPSRQEGLGSAALLAMALDRPVVATAAGGIPEMIAHEQTGLLVAPARPEELAAACARLLGAPALAAQVTAAARRQVRERHDIRHLAERTLDAYHRHRSRSA